MLQGSTTHNTVIDNHQIIDTGDKASVSNVIYVSSQIIPTVSLCNKGTELYVFYSHFLTADTAGKNNFQLLHTGIVSQCSNLAYLFFIQIIIQPLQHSVESNFSRVGDKRENGMIDIVMNGFQNSGNQFFSQKFSFFIDIDITSTGEVNTLKGASASFAWLIDLRCP